MNHPNMLIVLKKVNILYEEYIKSHDYFMSKWMTFRYFISFIDKINPVEYDVLLSNMDIVLSHLKSSIEELDKNRSNVTESTQNDFNSIYSYSRELYNAIWIFREILHKIQLHQEGKTRYTLSNYNFDMKRYKTAVKKYYKIGESYNAFLDKENR